MIRDWASPSWDAKQALDWTSPSWAEDDEFKEDEHERDPSGKFTKGGAAKPPFAKRKKALDSALCARALATARRLYAADRAPSMAFDHGLVHGALRSQVVRLPLAMDQHSVRTFSPDGHLHVALSSISRAQVSPYWGREIPDAEKFGLDPDKKYMLLRDPDELQKAAQSFNGIPILIEHQPISSDQHPHELVVGSTGTDARYEHPMLMNSLHIWAKPAIDAIRNGERRELSCAYHYDYLPQPGVYEGRRFDGRMTNIHGNHLALVPEGRVGPAAIVADAMPSGLR